MLTGINSGRFYEFSTLVEAKTESRRSEGRFIKNIRSLFLKPSKKSHVIFALKGKIFDLLIRSGALSYPNIEYLFLKIIRANSVRALWHMRVDFFEAISYCTSESVAMDKMGELEDYFDGSEKK